MATTPGINRTQSQATPAEWSSLSSPQSVWPVHGLLSSPKFSTRVPRWVR